MYMAESHPICALSPLFFRTLSDDPHYSRSSPVDRLNAGAAAAANSIMRTSSTSTALSFVRLYVHFLNKISVQKPSKGESVCQRWESVFFENGEPVLLDLQSTHEIIGQFRAALLPTRMPRARQARVTTCTPFILRVFLSAIPPSPERFVRSLRGFARFFVHDLYLSPSWPRNAQPNPTKHPSIIQR